MLNWSSSNFIIAHRCMFATNHCQLNRLMSRETLGLTNLAFCGHHHIPRDGPIPSLNWPCLTVTDVLITWFHSLMSISIAAQVCSKHLELKPKLIEYSLCSYLIELPFLEWANRTRPENQAFSEAGVGRQSTTAELLFPLQVPLVTWVCGDLPLLA